MLPEPEEQDPHSSEAAPFFSGDQRQAEPDAAALRGTVSSLDLRESTAAPISGWDVLLVAVMFVGSDLLITAAAGLYAFRVYHETLEELVSDTQLIVPTQIVAYALTFVVMYVIVTRSHNRPFWRGIRWIWPAGAGRIIGLALAGVPLALAVSYLESVLPMPSQVPFERLFTSAAAAYSVGVLAVLAAPFMEELFFRGFLYPVLRRWGNAIAVLLTALAFAAVHGGQYGWSWSVVLLMFGVGLVLTIACAWTGSVATGFLIHGGYNLTLFVLLFFSTDRFRHLERMTQ